MAVPAPELSAADLHTLTTAWLNYVHDEREDAGMERHLSRSTRCLCGKSNTSYPHWPPTIHREAIAQLECLTSCSFPHRLYLADCWITTLYRQEARNWTDTAEVEGLISLVESACGKEAESSQQIPVERTRKKKMRFANQCFSRKVVSVCVVARNTGKNAQCTAVARLVSGTGLIISFKFR